MKIGFGNYTYFDPNADDKKTYKTATYAQKPTPGYRHELPASSSPWHHTPWRDKSLSSRGSE